MTFNYVFTCAIMPETGRKLMTKFFVPTTVNN